MTDAEMIEKLTELHARATQGTWVANGTCVSWRSEEKIELPGGGSVPCASKRVCLTDNKTYMSRNEQEGNAASIAASRNALPRLIGLAREALCARRLLVLDAEWMSKQECPTTPIYVLTQCPQTDDNNYHDIRTRNELTERDGNGNG